MSNNILSNSISPYKALLPRIQEDKCMNIYNDIVENIERVPMSIYLDSSKCWKAINVETKKIKIFNTLENKVEYIYLTTGRFFD